MATTSGGKGVYNALCDGCGFKFKNYELRKRWDGLMMCVDDWEMRHPLDFYKARNDVTQLPWTRPDNDGIDVGPTYTYPSDPSYDTCTVVTRAPIVDQGTVGCIVIHT